MVLEDTPFYPWISLDICKLSITLLYCPSKKNFKGDHFSLQITSTILEGHLEHDNRILSEYSVQTL